MSDPFDSTEEIERFILGEDREAFLSTLVQGTLKYYGYKLLHLLHSDKRGDKKPEITETIREMKDKFPRISSDAMKKMIVWFQMYLFDHAKKRQEKKEVIDFLIDHLNLSFSHSQIPRAHERKSTYPSTLDPSCVDLDKLLHDKIRSSYDVSSLTAVGVWEYFDRIDKLKPSNEVKNELLNRVEFSVTKNVLDVIRKQLEDDDYFFGQHSIHQKLTLKQIETLAKDVPKIRSTAAYVDMVVSRLRPNDDVDMKLEPLEELSYIKRVMGFLDSLSHKDHALWYHFAFMYRYLVLLRKEEGIFDKDVFMKWISIPCNFSPQKKEVYQDAPTESRISQSVVNVEWISVTAELYLSIVTEFLEHFFIEEGMGEKDFAPFFRQEYLRVLYCKTVLMQGDPAQAPAIAKRFDKIQPSSVDTLRQEVIMEFSKLNKKQFRVNEVPNLIVRLKNVPSLMMNVYELDTDRLFREHSEVPVDLDLTGILPSTSKSFTYDHSPIRAHDEEFKFDDFIGRGIRVVEFVGKGRSVRAVIQKGNYRVIERTETTGQLFNVFDEDDGMVTEDFNIRIGTRTFYPDEEGCVLVPFTHGSTSNETMVILYNGVAFPQKFVHRNEEYALTTAFFIERESLRAGELCTGFVHARLDLCGEAVSLSLVKEVTLTVRCFTNQDVPTEKVYRNFKLADDSDATFDFRVPDLLNRVEITLSGQVHVNSTGNDLSVGGSETYSFDIRGLESHFLRLADTGFEIHVIGRNGEPCIGYPITVNLQHEALTSTLSHTVQTDESGSAGLGVLPGVLSVQEGGNTFPIQKPFTTFMSGTQILAGEDVDIPFDPLCKELTTADVSIIEKRGGKVVADLTNLAKIMSNGVIRISNLPAGTFEVSFLRIGKNIVIRVVNGKKVADNHILKTKKSFQSVGGEPVHLASMQFTDESLEIEVANVTPIARVHLIPTVFQQAFPVSNVLFAPSFEKRELSFEQRVNLFLKGRDVGDELQYVLDRKGAQKFPGNSLSRAGLLLNPWNTREVESVEEQLRGSGEFRMEKEEAAPCEPCCLAADASCFDSYYGGPGGGGSGGVVPVDFLGHKNTALYNLKPDENGIIKIDHRIFDWASLLTIVVLDHEGHTTIRVPLPATKIVFRDLRLKRTLDLSAHLGEKKTVKVVDAETGCVLDDVARGGFQMFDTIPKVYHLFTTLQSSPILAEFSFVSEWTKLSPSEKLKKYAKYACHELHVFLWRKDPEFFENVVRPHLCNKKEKTVVDYVLLGEDVKEFMEPWRYEKLNAFEKILVAHEIGGELGKETLRSHIIDVVEKQKYDHASESRAFDAALQSKDMDERENAMDFEFMKVEEEEEEMCESEEVNGLLDFQPERVFAKRAAPAMMGFSMRSRAAPPPAPRPAEAEKKKRMSKGRGGGVPRRLRGGAPPVSQVQQLFQQVEKTKEWAENNYYHVLRKDESPSMIFPNEFWKDYALYDGRGNFLSTSFHQATHNFTECMLVLGLMDLPFELGDKTHSMERTDEGMHLLPVNDIVTFQKEILSFEFEEAGLLAHQSFFDPNNRYKETKYGREEIRVTEEFLSRHVYGCQVVVTNVSSSQQHVRILYQIPQGSLRYERKPRTDTQFFDISPFSTVRFEFSFYFPIAGEFNHYPIHITRGDEVVAFERPFKFHVVDELTKLDEMSWHFISQYADDKRVFEYLAAENLHGVNLSMIAWRCHEQTFYTESSKILRNRGIFHPDVAMYALYHRDLKSPDLKAYMQAHSGLKSQAGPYIESTLLSFDPFIDGCIEQLEYSPVVNARVHQVGQKRQIRIPALAETYRRFLLTVLWKETMTAVDELALVYYLLLQDRVDEAIKLFIRMEKRHDCTDPKVMWTKMQYDFMGAYLALFQSDVKKAHMIASQYLNCSVERWRRLFESVVNLIEGRIGDLRWDEQTDEMDREAKHAFGASKDPFIAFEVEHDEVTVEWKNITEFVVGFTQVDLETLFSVHPGRMQENWKSFIKPHVVRTIAVEEDAKEGVKKVSLPDEMKGTNVVVEVSAEGIRKHVMHFANSLKIQVSQNYASLRVTHKNSKDRLLSMVYVKVFATSKDGRTVFFKDGYTDVCGVFNYGTVTGQMDLKSVSEFHILVLSEEHGGLIQHVAPPIS